MIVNLASIGGVLASVPGSLSYQHPMYVRRWYMRELGRVSYLGGTEYLSPASLTIEFREPVLSVVDGVTVNTDNKVTTTAYKSLLFRHNREKAWEFLNRGRRAYYQNFVRTIVNALVSHALKPGVTRKGDDKMTKFWGGVDYKRKRSMDTFMRTGLRWATIEGIMWACVDAPEDTGEGKDPYVYWVNPLDILDWEVDNEGELVWLKQFVFASKTRDWKQAFEPRYRYRIWTRTDVTTYETGADGSGQEQISQRDHGAGKVPFVPLYSVRDEDDNVEDGTPLAGDLCKAANHVFNLCSLLSEIGYKQTFSWLTIPDKNVDVLQAGLNTAFGYDPSGGGAPEYISPDAEQARVLMEMIRDAITQARQSIGIGRGRGEESQAQASGDAMEMASEDKRSILGDITAEAQDFEIRLAELVMGYRTGGKVSGEAPVITYGTDFDMRSFKADVDDALALSKLKLSDEVSIELVQDLVRKRFAGMPAADLQKLADSIKAKFAADAKAVEEMRTKMAANGGVGDGGNGPPFGGGGQDAGSAGAKPKPGDPNADGDRAAA